MKKTTIMVAVVLAVAAVLTVGLTVLPTSIEDAQANPCANEISRGGSADNAFIPQDDDERECDFTGYFDFDEEIDSEDIPPTTPTPPPPAIIFTIIGDVRAEETTCTLADTSMALTADIYEDGTVTGTVAITEASGETSVLAVNEGTTDGETFSLSGESGFCQGQPFTVSGGCLSLDNPVRYEEGDDSGVFNLGAGSVACTRL